MGRTSVRVTPLAAPRPVAPARRTTSVPVLRAWTPVRTRPGAAVTYAKPRA